MKRLLSAFLFSAAILSADTVHYDVISLGDFEPTAINNAGTVVGSLTNHVDHTYAVRYRNGVTEDIGNLGGTLSYAMAINNAGTIVGSSTTNGSSGHHAFIFSGGVMQDLGPLTLSADSINSSGTIAGYSRMTDHGFTINNGVMQELGTLGGTHSAPSAINDSGTVAGSAYTAGNASQQAHQHAVVWDAAGNIQDLGTLFGTNSFARDINDAGTVVGFSFSADNSGGNGFIYSNGLMQDLGTLGGAGSAATAINNAGTVVGGAYTCDNIFEAFIYNDGQMTNLNSLVDLPGIILHAAQDINDSGQIVAVTSDGHGYLLTPHQSTNCVPDSSLTIVLLVPAFLVLSALRRWFVK